MTGLGRASISLPQRRPEGIGGEIKRLSKEEYLIRIGKAVKRVRC